LAASERSSRSTERSGFPTAAAPAPRSSRTISEANSTPAWLAASRISWLSVWEVTHVEKGKSLGLEDLIAGETGTVLEVSGSKMLGVHQAILGHVVDFEGASVLAGPRTSATTSARSARPSASSKWPKFS